MVLTQNENDYLKFINGIRGPSAAIYLFQLTQKMGNGEYFKKTPPPVELTGWHLSRIKVIT